MSTTELLNFIFKKAGRWAAVALLVVTMPLWIIPAIFNELSEWMDQ